MGARYGVTELSATRSDNSNDPMYVGNWFSPPFLFGCPNPRIRERFAETRAGGASPTPTTPAHWDGRAIFDILLSHTSSASHSDAKNVQGGTRRAQAFRVPRSGLWKAAARPFSAVSACSRRAMEGVRRHAISSDEIGARHPCWRTHNAPTVLKPGTNTADDRTAEEKVKRVSPRPDC